MKKLVDEVRNIFDTKFPFSLLSNVILYRNDKKDTDLWANEIDYLFHYTNKGNEHLVIVEVKDRDDIYGDTQSQLPTTESSWKLIYNNSEKGTKKEKDIKKQVNDQAEALRQFCQNIPQSIPVRIERWIVHKYKNIQHVIQDKSDSLLKLLTLEGFENNINRFQNVVRVEHSDFLRELRKGIISQDTGHPEIPNAIQFIDMCRKSLDDRIYEFFTPTSNYHAINGCAGMGKSVLLAYSIYAFASNYKVEHKNGNRELINFNDNAQKIGLPIHKERKIYAYAVKQKQIDTLKSYWEKIKNQIALINPDSRPHLQNPVFGKWEGEIPLDCNILVIDESHDLSLEHQKIISNWKNQNSKSSNYLLVACDRNQALKREDSDENIIAGVNFSLHSTRLNRIYRCPFPVYVASIGLMFRWFASKGAKVLLSTQRLREHFGFQPKPEEDNDCIFLTMRNDCHPGNNWNQTVNFFKNCSMAFKHLSQFYFEKNFEKKDVLWVSFRKLDSDFDYTEIQGKFTYVDLRNDADDEIDRYIKGQEFAIVIIEGLPSDMNPQDMSDKEDWGNNITESERVMWKSRRNLYVVCSRASAFLYFIADIDKTSPDANIQELKNLIDQVSHPFRGKNESGQTWIFRINRPMQSSTRKPLVFRDIDDFDEKAQEKSEKTNSVDIKNTENKDIEKSEPTKKLRVVEIKKTRVVEFDGNLTVNELADAFGISSEEFQKRLPDDAKAKSDNDKTVKPSHAKEVAFQLDIEFKRVKKASSVNIEDTKEKDKGSVLFNQKKVVDIYNNTPFSKILSDLDITREQFLTLVSPEAKEYHQQNGKWTINCLIEVGKELGIEVRYTPKGSSDDNNGKESSVKLPQNNAVLNESGIKQTHISVDSSPERRIIRRNNISDSYQRRNYYEDKISQDALIDYIVKVLYEHGGSADKSYVDEEIYRMLKHIFRQTWYQETVANGVPRWKHNIAWAKDRARQHHGLVKSAGESGRGRWELTNSGKRYYQEKNLRNLT